MAARAHATATSAVRQANPDHRPLRAEVNVVHRVNQKLVILRQAIDESRIKHAALAAMLGVKPSYLSMLLSGEKTWTVKHQDDLPDEIEVIYARLYAEAFGHVVVPPVHGEDAVRQLVAGLVGVLRSPRLDVPVRMAKAALPEEPER